MRLLVLLVVVRLDDVAHDGASRFATVLSAFLDQHGDNNLRIAARRVAYEPCIVFEFFLFADACASVVTNHLRRSGFSAEFDARKFELAAGAVGFVDDAVHGVGDLFDGVL